MKYLLDTCVISELVKSKPEKRVINWIDSIDEDKLFLSVITIGEIIKGIEKLKNHGRKQKIHDWLYDELVLRFDQRILLLDLPVLVTWGQLMAKLELSGKKMPSIDSLIAATAIQNDLVRNKRESSFATPAL